MAAALANGRQRQLLADAQAVAAALKELPHTSACDEQQVRSGVNATARDRTPPVQPRRGGQIQQTAHDPLCRPRYVPDLKLCSECDLPSPPLNHESAACYDLTPSCLAIVS
jgi:hypothetical protein